MKGIKLLKQDVQRGVKLIKDKNYNSDCNGVTKISMNFFKNLINKNFLNVRKVYYAQLKYHNKHWYSLSLRTVDGYSFNFYGVSFGYHGEGSRGSKEILDICGFKNTDRVFDRREHFNENDKMIFFKRM